MSGAWGKQRNASLAVVAVADGLCFVFAINLRRTFQQIVYCFKEYFRLFHFSSTIHQLKSLSIGADVSFTQTDSFYLRGYSAYV